MRQTTGADSQMKDTRMLLMQQPRYRPILPNVQSLDDVADIGTHPTGLTQFGYHCDLPPRVGDESVAMLLEPLDLTQIGLVPHGYFDHLPRAHSSAYMEDSETQVPSVDIDEDGSDSQEPQPDDPAQQVLGVDEVQMIGMYVCQPVLFISIYLYMFL